MEIRTTSLIDMCNQINFSNKTELLFNFAVDKNGDVCISILHEPGEDKYGYEKPEERWLPIHTVETIMISVISMLADPNGDSPANVDAAVRWPRAHISPPLQLNSEWQTVSLFVYLCVYMCTHSPQSPQK